MKYKRGQKSKYSNVFLRKMKSRAKSLLIFCSFLLAFSVQLDAYQAHDHSINGMLEIIPLKLKGPHDMDLKIWFFRKGTKYKKQIPSHAVPTHNGSRSILQRTWRYESYRRFLLRINFIDALNVCHMMLWKLWDKRKCLKHPSQGDLS